MCNIYRIAQFNTWMAPMIAFAFLPLFVILLVALTFIAADLLTAKLNATPSSPEAKNKKGNYKELSATSR